MIFVKKLLLFCLGMVFIVIGLSNPMTFIFALWVFVSLFKAPLVRVFSKIPGDFAFVVAGLLFGILTELFAIISNLSLPPDERILLHPDPLIDLIYGFLYYLFVILTWYFLLRRVCYSKIEIFLLTGIYGVFVEETGQVFLRIFSQPVTGVLYAIIVVFVYGIFPMLALMVAEKGFSGKRKESSLMYNFLAAFALFLQYAVYGNFVYPVLEKYFS